MFARHNNDWHELDIEVLSEKDMFGISSIAGDLDMNGSYEILNTHGDSSHSPITLYSIKPTGKWIKFSILFKNGGIPRGSVVRLRTTLRDQVRVISPGSGRFANYGLELLFGLIKDESILSLEVILPSGNKSDFQGNFKPMNNNNIVI